MDKPTVVILLIFALVVFLAILKRRNRLAAGSMPWPFYVKRLLTQPEQVLSPARQVASQSRRPRAGSDVQGSWRKEGLPIP
jgi:hypothetical protein